MPVNTADPRLAPWATILRHSVARVRLPHGAQCHEYRYVGVAAAL